MRPTQTPSSVILLPRPHSGASLQNLCISAAQLLFCRGLLFRRGRNLLFAALLLTSPVHAQNTPDPAIAGQAIYTLTQQLLAVAPKRFNGSPGHLAAETFIKDHFKPEASKGNLEVDEFTATTPAGPQTFRNYIVKFQGRTTRTGEQSGIIVLASHYETNYPLRNTAFVGANDGACTSALLIWIGQYLRTHPPTGYSVWLVFDDGEEAVESWSASDSLYGTRHLAARWYGDGTLKRIKALLVADMIGDRDLNIDRVSNSAPWLLDILSQAAKNTGHGANIFKYSEAEEDDHLPFVQRGVSSLDVIDAHYGPSTASEPDGFHHTSADTLDKLSPRSLGTSADLFLEMIRLINQR